MIRFRCKTCGKKLKADERIAGRRVHCTKCESVEIVPQEATSTKAVGKSENSPKDLEKEPENALGKQREMRASSGSGNFEFAFPSLKKSSDKSLLGKQSFSKGQDFTPQFQLAGKKVSHTRRVVMFGMIGSFLLVSVLVAVNFDRLMKARKMLSTDYEEMAEVVYNRNAVKKLEKSYRMMDIAGRTYLAMNPDDQDSAKEFQELKSATLKRTRTSDLEEDVESYFRQGEDIKAKALLVNTAVELDAWRGGVDLKTKFFSERSY